jgi:tetratricopeptide (TPR) repeat protein
MACPFQRNSVGLLFTYTPMKRCFSLWLCMCAALWLYGQDKRKVDSLRSVITLAANDSVTINAWNDLSFEYQKVDPDSALLLAQKAQALSVKVSYMAGQATALHNIGNVNYFKGEFSTALGFYEKALVLRYRTGNKKDIARTIGNIGNVHFARGDYDKAMIFYQRMFSTGDSIKDAVTLADANGNIANVYMMKGSYDKSLEYNLRSLKIREALNDTRGMEHSYNNIGGIYFNQGNNVKALEYIKKALYLQERIGNKKGMSDSYQNIGSIYYHLKSIDSAFAYFNRSMKITEELGNRSGIAGGYDNFGNIYKENKQYTKAIEYHKKAAALYEEIGDQKGMANAYGNLGGDYTVTGDFPTALLYINKALEIGKRTGAKYYIRNAYDFFAVLYKKMNDPRKALGYEELSTAMGDSLLNEENTRNIAEMQTRFDTEKKEKEIELLQKDSNLKELELSASSEKNRSLQTLIYVLAGGLLLLFALVLLIYRGSGQKKKNNALLTTTNEELNRQKEMTEQKNQLIVDSVDYAQTLIGLRLPTSSAFKKYFSDVVIIDRPADIIGGCMYSLFGDEEDVWIVTIDCATTGIPGAFLALSAQQVCERVMSRKNDAAIEDLFHSLSEELETVMSEKGVHLALVNYRKRTALSSKSGDGMYVQEGNNWITISNHKNIPAVITSAEELEQQLQQAAAASADTLIIGLKK